jgi:hypothetical protein
MEYYSAIKKNKITSFTRKWVVLEIMMLNKISQTQKDKHHVFSHIWSLKAKDMKKGEL